MSRPCDPKVGKDRPLEVIKKEAEAFLHEILDDGRFANQHAFKDRLQEVTAEIDAGAVETTVWVEVEEIINNVRQLKRVRKTGVSSRGWRQTEEEVSWGVQVAWRNSRKCIMRADYQDLSSVSYHVHFDSY
jgi:nitric oxide synthase oxygenase domain/subunit